MVPTETLSSLGNVFDFTRSTREFSSSFTGPFCKISCRMRTSDQLHVTKKKLAQSLFFPPLFPAPAACISYSGPHIMASTVHHVYYELSGQLKAPTNYALIGPQPGLQIVDAKKLISPCRRSSRAATIDNRELLQFATNSSLCCGHRKVRGDANKITDFEHALANFRCGTHHTRAVCTLLLSY